MRTARLRLLSLLIAPRTIFGRSELVHLCHPLLELDVLAFLVAVPLLLYVYVSICPSNLSSSVQPGLGAIGLCPTGAAGVRAVGCGPTSHFQGR